ncbi:FYVE and coiled-coil domain-containing protein 1 isoform X4 [Hydra vulgaris]|uniref:FYVE and coiled-coil domain-containing protein 1 isoform X4 n=1 Tax=Hydra vulgaris TaxID=6087 RepID=A0ABM4CXN0_HYDVU
MQNISSTYFKVEQLLSEIQELVASIQSIHSKESIPLNDDSLQVHRLCMALENIFRVGAKEKYSFTGAKKDFWNFLSESLPKEEIIRFINSISDFRTYQGKGRAFIRQALMEKCLADTLQRCIINEKFIKDYFEAGSIFQNKTLFGSLINSLYDLNSIPFNLPYKGYDLDRSWPSFSRTAFYEKKRSSSQSSLLTLNEEVVSDLFLLLKNHINMLDILLRDWDSGYKPENISKVYSHPLEEFIDMLMTVHSELVKLKLSHQKLNDDFNALEKEKMFIQVDSDFRIKQLQEQSKEIEKNLLSNQSELEALKSENVMLLEKCKVQEEKLYKYFNTTNDFTHKIANLEEQNKMLKLEINNLTYELNKKNETIAVQEKELLVLQNINAKSEQKFEELMRDIKDQIQESHISLNDQIQESYISLNGIREYDLKIQNLEKKLEDESRKKDYLETLLKKNEFNSEKQLHNMWQVFIKEVTNLFKADISKDQIDDVISLHHGEDAALKIITKIHNQFEATKILKTQAEESAENHKLEKAELEKNLNDLQKDILALQNQVETLKVEISILNRENEVALKDNEFLKAEVQKVTIGFESFKLKFEHEENAKKSQEDSFKNEICILSEEVKSLEFHLSTNEIKYKDILKEKESCKVDYEKCKVDYKELVNSFENIQSLNSSNLKEILYLQEEKKQKIIEILEMKSEIDNLKLELKNCFKEREDVYELYQKAKEDFDRLNIEKSISEHKYEEIIQQIKSDTDDMKDQLIKLAKDKEELWEQKNALEITLHSRIANYCVDDKDVEKCMHCLKIFSLANRKHHCRLCCGTFCKVCSNEKIQTQFSRKKIRCCQTCVSLFKDKYSLEDVVADDASSDTSSIYVVNVSSLTEEDLDELSPGGFEELDQNDVNSSKIISQNMESIRLFENDIKQNAIVPIVQQDNDGPGDKIDFLITAGTQCLFPLVVGSIKFELVWEFESSPKDISFGIAYKENEQVLDNQIETVIPLSRYCSHRQVIHGRMRVDKPGIYIIVFSNLYSRGYNIGNLTLHRIKDEK